MLERREMSASDGRRYRGRLAGRYAEVAMVMLRRRSRQGRGWGVVLGRVAARKLQADISSAKVEVQGSANLVSSTANAPFLFTEHRL